MKTDFKKEIEELAKKHLVGKKVIEKAKRKKLYTLLKQNAYHGLFGELERKRTRL